MDKSKVRKAQFLKKIDEINKKEGKGTITTLNKEGKKGLDVPRTPTGIEGLDHVLGGGVPYGRQIEISGEKSAGKTTLAYYLSSLYDYTVFHPVEGTFDWERAEIFGNTDGQMYINRSTTGESYMNRTQDFAEMGVPFQVIDSVPWLRAKAEIEKRKKAANTNTIQEQRMSPTTKVINPYIAEIGLGCEMTGGTVVWVNQVRQKMNAMPFGDKFDTPGGEMLHHAFSICLRLTRKEWIKINNYDPRNTATKEVIGIIIKIRCTKNKLSPPYRECELVYLYDRGFVSHAELPALKKEIQEQKKEFYAKKKNYKKQDEIDDWEEEESGDWDDE